MAKGKNFVVRLDNKDPHSITPPQQDDEESQVTIQTKEPELEKSKTEESETESPEETEKFKTEEPEAEKPKEKKKTGRPKVKEGEYKTINISVPVDMLKKMEVAKVKHGNNLTAYVNAVIKADLDANYEKYLQLQRMLNE